MVTEPEERALEGAGGEPRVGDPGAPAESAWNSLDDPRLSSGVPEASRADELDFIEMTGLTRPPGAADAAPPSGPAVAPRPEEAPRATVRAIEAADALEEDADDSDEDDALARALEALAALPAPSSATDDAAEVESLASRIRAEILDELREDMSREDAPRERALPAAESSETDAPVAGDRTPLSANPTLREAERLVQELQDQPREPEPRPEPAPPPEPSPVPVSAPAIAPLLDAQHAADREAQRLETKRLETERRHGERRSVSRLYAERHRDVHGYLAAYTGEPARPESDEPEVEVDFSNDPPKHRHRRLTKKQRNTRRAIIAFLALLLVSSLAYIGWQYAEPYIQTAGTLYREAEQLEVNGRAREASNRYRAFLTRYPNDPRAAEALFRAGFVLQVEELGPASPRALQDSVNLFERFIAQYPDHDKVHRARTLRGILLFRLGDYETAVTTLRDPALHLADPAAALPVWRTLAQAYQALGDTASARSEFLKAASLQGNYNADEDYEALARMYKRLAEQAGEGEDRTEYLLEGISYFRQAAMVAGVSRDRQQTLQREIDFLQREIEDDRGGTARQAARAEQEPAFWRMLESNGDPTELAVEPAEALTILDGLEGALPSGGVEPGVSPDPAFDGSADEMDDGAAAAEQDAEEMP